MMRKVQRAQNPAVKSRTASRRRIRPSVLSPAKPKIRDAVQDGDGLLWVRYGTARRSQWFTVQDLQRDERAVFSKLASPEHKFLTSRARQQFRAELEAHTSFRRGLVASRPGWNGKAYVLGDGTVIYPPGQRDKMIVAFDPNPRARQCGSLREWKREVAPFIAGQQLPIFVLSFAFVGPLLAFAPAHVGNPMVELAGPTEKGKSTIAALGASIWGGDPADPIGASQTWDATINANDQIKRAYADALLVLDEANLAGANRREQRELISKTVFNLANAKPKRRQTDAGWEAAVRLVVMSTSNEPLANIIEGAPRVRNAITSRMVTVPIDEDRPFGTLDSLPAGISNAREAFEALLEVIGRQYGTPIRAFLRKLVREASSNPSKLRDRIKRLYRGFVKKAKRSGGGNVPARNLKAFAMAYVAGRLAKEWGAIPKSWGNLGVLLPDLLAKVAGEMVHSPSPSALDRVADFIERVKDDLIPVAEIQAPLAKGAFQKAAGFIRTGVEGSLEILIPSPRLQSEFPKDFQEIMTELRDAGLAQTEKGKSPKLTVKAPKRLCADGRVYCIRLKSELAGLASVVERTG